MAILLALAPLSLAQAQTAPPADSQVAVEASERLAIAREIVAATFPEAQREAMVRSLMEAMLEQIRQASPPVGQEPGIKIIMDRHYDRLVERSMPLFSRHFPALLESMAVAYSNRYSLEELSEIHRFTATPTGARFVSEGMDIMSDPAVAAVNQVIYRDANELQRRLIAELTDELGRYYEAHPPRE